MGTSIFCFRLDIRFLFFFFLLLFISFFFSLIITGFLIMSPSPRESDGVANKLRMFLPNFLYSHSLRILSSAFFHSDENLWFPESVLTGKTPLLRTQARCSSSFLVTTVTFSATKYTEWKATPDWPVAEISAPVCKVSMQALVPVWSSQSWPFQF